MPTDERVLAIPTVHFQAIGAFQGFRPADVAYREAILDPRHFGFHRRKEVETDPAFKQLIPYVILCCGERMFHYRRGAAGTEKRLLAMRSIGIGGHISEHDASGDGDAYTNGMGRELREEVTFGAIASESLIGFINDDRTFVGSVHLGVVHRLELEIEAVTANEAAIADTGFATIAELWAEREQFETWSQFVLEALIARSKAPGQSFA